MSNMRLTPFFLYPLPDNGGEIKALIQSDTLWLSQKAMAQLFGCSTDNVGLHLKNIYQDKELSEEATTEEFSVVQQEGQREVQRTLKFYHLDAIISVGYRINSQKATRFRQWATQVLNEYIRKGFVMDDERLKQGENVFGKDYFKELLERVRSIRASERRIWQQITDIYAECSIDYDAHSLTTHEFYAMIQNRFHYAISGCTAAEIVYNKADHNKAHMGLTTWKDAPDGRILKADVVVAKNYLSEKEIRKLERVVTGFFDYIEDLVERETSFTMADFSNCVDAFLSFRGYKLLDGKGSVSHEKAKTKAYAEYELFNPTQRIVSDFDKLLKKGEESRGGTSNV